MIKNDAILATIICVTMAATEIAIAAPRTKSTAERELSERATKNLEASIGGIQFGMCDNQGNLCKPATAAELKSPPLSLKHAIIATSAGVLSGIATKCGWDWSKRIFQPLMFHLRHKERINERALTLAAMIHGIEQQRVLKASSANMCTPELKQQIIHDPI